MSQTRRAAAASARRPRPTPPDGHVFLTDAQGRYLIDAQGRFLTEPA